MSLPRRLFSPPNTPSRVDGLKARTLKLQLEQVKPEEVQPNAAPIGRRGSPRLRLSIPAKLISLYGSHRCILIDLSCSGAQVGLERTLDMNETAFLEIAGLELFCEVVRTAQGDNGGVNGLVFDPPLEHQDVLNLRSFAESYQDEDLKGLRSEVKAWVDGVV